MDATIDCLIVSILFLSQVPSRLTLKAAVIWWFDGYIILCLLIWQATFFFIDTAKEFLPLHPHTTYHPKGEGEKRRDMAGAAEATPMLHQEWLLRIIWLEP